jgi:hypothetical protein
VPLGKNIYPKLLSQMLGYCSSISIPLDIYSYYLLPDMQESAVLRALEEALK